jgi:hypothetical protein
VPRWIVSAVTVLVLALQSIGTYAAAGVKTDVHCCCPDAAHCKCHDHVDRGAQDSIKRCGGAVRHDAPIVTATVMPEPPLAVTEVASARIATWTAPANPPDRSIVPEKPPF